MKVKQSPVWSTVQPRGTIDSDNGGVLEPMLSLSTTFLSRLTGALSFSWRLAFAFEALGGLESRKLRGPSLNVALVLGPF